MHVGCLGTWIDTDLQTALLGPLCAAQLAYLRLASTHAKPSNIAPLLGPQADAIGAIIEAKDKLGRGKEGREWGACLSTVAEGVSAWGWVQVVSYLVHKQPLTSGACSCSFCGGDEKFGAILGRPREQAIQG
jgi:hypothetical protein